MKRISINLLVFFISVFLVLAWGGFRYNAYLSDDNVTQWYPVIERAYSDFFSTGKMPTYNFFQFKGYSISEQGYYGIMNPLMCISYLLSHGMAIPFSTLTIYIAILFGLGNLVFFNLCGVLKNNIWQSAILTIAYSGISVFWSFSYWYYVFNNYFFIPLLILIFLKSREKRSAYFGCGIVLALEILFGNVQYTCYHYMFYCILCCMFFLFGKRKYFIYMITNVMLAGVLSFPYLLLALNASSRFVNKGFHSMSCINLELFLEAFLPIGITIKMGMVQLPFITTSLMTRIDCTWGYNGGIMIICAFCGCYTIWLLIKSLRDLFKSKILSNMKITDFAKMSKEVVLRGIANSLSLSDQKILFFSLLVCVLFFLSFLNDGLVAFILGKLPVIKQFRYLFKVLFVLYPLLALTAATVFPWAVTKFSAKIVIATTLFSILGIVNNGFVAQEVSMLFSDEPALSMEEEYDYAEKTINQYCSELDQYRFITIFQMSTLAPDCYRCYKGFLRNYPTALGIYAPLGYEITAPVDHIQQMDHLYDIDGFQTNMTGVSIMSDFLEGFNDNSELAKKQIINNSIKYILVEKDMGDLSFAFYKMKGWENVKNTSNISYIPKLLNRTQNILDVLSGMEVEEVISINNEFDLICLKGINGLCHDGISALPIKSKRMDQISFQTSGASQYTLSFAFNQNISAYVYDEAGTKTELEVLESEEGNILINVPQGINGTVVLEYHKTMNDVGFVFEVLITLVFISLLWSVFVGKKTWKESK